MNASREHQTLPDTMFRSSSSSSHRRGRSRESNIQDSYQRLTGERDFTRHDAGRQFTSRRSSKSYDSGWSSLMRSRFKVRGLSPEPSRQRSRSRTPSLRSSPKASDFVPGGTSQLRSLEHIPLRDRTPSQLRARLHSPDYAYMTRPKEEKVRGWVPRPKHDYEHTRKWSDLAYKQRSTGSWLDGDDGHFDGKPSSILNRSVSQRGTAEEERTRRELRPDPLRLRGRRTYNDLPEHTSRRRSSQSHGYRRPSQGSASGGDSRTRQRRPSQDSYASEDSYGRARGGLISMGKLPRRWPFA